MAGLWAVGFTATLAAVGAYFVLGGFLYVAGLPAEVALSPAAYAVFSLAALFNPLYAAILPLLLPSVSHQATFWCSNRDAQCSFHLGLRPCNQALYELRH